MAKESCSDLLVVEKSEVVLVKPSKPIPDASLSLSTIDNDPLFESVDRCICVYAPRPYLEGQPNYDPATLLQHALSRALVFYYPLAGRLHRKSDDHMFQLNYKAGEDGVPFVKATVACTLSSLDYLENIGDNAYQLVPSHDPKQDCEGYDPLALQVTQFSCGGIAIGMAFAHSVCDGIGIAQFFRTMMELASGKTQPKVIPVWERERLTLNDINGGKYIVEENQSPQLVDLMKIPSIATSPYKVTEDMVHEILSITSKDIMKLKKIVAEEEQTTNNEKDAKDVSATTLEIIAALMWRAKGRALDLNPEGLTVLGTSVNIRNIIEPPLPKGYYGNAIVFAFGVQTIKELRESSLSRVVRLIKDSKRMVLDKRYISGQLRLSEERLKETKPSDDLKGGHFGLTDLRNIGLQCDGWGELVNIIPLVGNSFVCILLPGSKVVPGMSDGVRLMVTLPKDAMAKFKEEMNAF